MNVFRWLTRRFTNQGRATALYKRGMTRARKRYHKAAIEDYTATLAMPDISVELTSMVLYNRALVYAATGDEEKAVIDLGAVLEMDDPPVNVRSMAKQKLARMESQHAREGA